MKTIGLLGGTGWSSTILYYKVLNELMNKRLGGYHSAKILLKSIDYHEIMSSYGKDHDKIAKLLHIELLDLVALRPDCIIICCNSLHKYYDRIKDNVPSSIPVLHAVDLVVNHLKSHFYTKVLLLATKFTLEDGFFAKKLEENGIKVTIPPLEERVKIQEIHDELIENTVTEKSKAYFRNLIASYNDLDAVVLGCTEFSLLIDQPESALPLINPLYLQATCAIDYALHGI